MCAQGRGHVGGLWVEEDGAGAGVAARVGVHLVEVRGRDAELAVGGIEPLVLGVEQEGELCAAAEGEVGVESENVVSLFVPREVVGRAVRLWEEVAPL